MPEPDPELQAIFDQLAEIKARYERGECDAEGHPTAYGLLLIGAQKVEGDQ